MSKEAMKLALEALEMWCPMTATYLNTRDKAITALREALAEQPAQQEPVATLFGSLPVYDTSPPAQRTWVGAGDLEDSNAYLTPPQRTEQPAPAQIDVHFLRQVIAVAIGGLYEHYKDDVLQVFTLDELQAVVDLSESLRPQQVENIYKRAWDMLAASSIAQAAHGIKGGA